MIVTPKTVFQRQVEQVIDEIEVGIIRSWDSEADTPLALSITSVLVDEAILEAVASIVDESSWYAEMTKVDGSNVVRISDEYFDMNQWLCRIGGSWHDEDMERCEVEMFSMAGMQKVTVCEKCKEHFDGSPGDAMPGGFMQPAGEA